MGCRDVVAKLAACTKRRGHRACRRIDMDSVRERTEQLPTNSVPAEISKLLPLGGLLDKMQI